jgi:hypothetical protein
MGYVISVECRKCQNWTARENGDLPSVAACVRASLRSCRGECPNYHDCEGSITCWYCSNYWLPGDQDWLVTQNRTEKIGSIVESN